MNTNNPSSRLVEYFLVVGVDEESGLVPAEGLPGGPPVFKTQVLDRYPETDHPDVHFPYGTSVFCFPRGGATLKRGMELPKYFEFVSTGNSGSHLFGFVLMIYEPLRAKLKADLLRSLNEENSDDVQQFYVPKCLCLLSHWPFRSQFRTFLTQLYRLSISSISYPLERIISNFVSEVPLPPRGKIRVMHTVGDAELTFCRPPANNPISFCDLGFQQVFECLDLPNILKVFSALLTERQILVRSTQLSLLGAFGEVFRAIMYPFNWTHVYIPVLPAHMLMVLQAPLPYLVGIEEEILQGACKAGYQIPPTAVVVNLDENTVFASSHELNAMDLPAHDLKKLLSRLTSCAPAFARRSEHWTQDILPVMDSAIYLAAKPYEIDEDTVAHVRRVAQSDGEYDVKGGVSVWTTLPNGECNWPLVRTAFFRFFTSILRDYREFLVYPVQMPKDPKAKSRYQSKEELQQARGSFNAPAFLARRRKQSERAFLAAFLQTQHFQCFIDDILHPDGARDADVVFFEQSLSAKFNRTFLGKLLPVMKTQTPFLNDRQYSITKTVVTNGPDLSRPEINDSLWMPANPQKGYDNFPRLMKELYGHIRPIPEILNSPEEELGQAPKLRARTRAFMFSKGKEEELDSASDVIYSTWFILFCSSIGRPTEFGRLLEQMDYSRGLRGSFARYSMGSDSEHTMLADEDDEDMDEFGDGEDVSDADSVATSPAAHSNPERKEDAPSKPRPKPLQVDTTTLTTTRQTHADDVSRDGLERGVQSEHGICRTARQDGSLPPPRAGSENFEKSRPSFPPRANSSNKLDSHPARAVEMSRARKKSASSQGGRIRSSHGRASRESVFTTSAPLSARGGGGRVSMSSTDAEAWRIEYSLAQLDLAFEVLEASRKWGNAANEVVYRTLIDACGRCGHTDYAIRVLGMMHENGIMADSLVYSNLVQSFSMNGDVSHSLKLDILNWDKLREEVQAANERIESSKKRISRRKVSEAMLGAGWLGYHASSSRLAAAVSVPERVQAAEALEGLSVSPRHRSRSKGMRNFAGSAPAQYPHTPLPSVRRTLHRWGSRKKSSNEALNKSFSSGVSEPSSASANADSFGQTSPSQGKRSAKETTTLRMFQNILFGSGRSPASPLSVFSIHASTTDGRPRETQDPSLSATTLSPGAESEGEGVAQRHETINLDHVFPGLVIDTERETCPQCQLPVRDEEIRRGWHSGDPNDYNTQCPNCGRKFVAFFTCFSSRPGWEGSKGPGTPLFCEFLPPWALSKEVRTILAHHDIEFVCNHEFRDVKGTVFWNLVLYFSEFSLPIGFLVGPNKNQMEEDWRLSFDDADVDSAMERVSSSSHFSFRQSFDQKPTQILCEITNSPERSPRTKDSLDSVPGLVTFEASSDDEYDEDPHSVDSKARSWSSPIARKDISDSTRSSKRTPMALSFHSARARRNSSKTSPSAATGAIPASLSSMESSAPFTSQEEREQAIRRRGASLSSTT